MSVAWVFCADSESDDTTAHEIIQIHISLDSITGNTKVGPYSFLTLSCCVEEPDDTCVAVGWQSSYYGGFI